MRKFVLALMMGVLLIGVVSAIECLEADYDGDGDVGFEDLFEFRQYYNNSCSNGTCTFWDYNNDGFVGDDDLASFNEWYQKECSLNCTDSDGGIEFGVTGETTIGSSIQRDSCTGKILSEWYCVSNGRSATSKICNIDCVDGRCIESSEITCEDSDGGSYPNVKGTIKTNIDEDPIYFEDVCTDGSHLKEYRCQNNDANFYVTDCPTGCSNGACVQGNETEKKSYCDSEGVCVLYIGEEVGEEAPLSGNEISINRFYDSGLDLLLSRQEITKVLRKGDKYFNSEFEIIILDIDGGEKVKFDFNLLINPPSNTSERAEGGPVCGNMACEGEGEMENCPTDCVCGDWDCIGVYYNRSEEKCVCPEMQGGCSDDADCYPLGTEVYQNTYRCLGGNCYQYPKEDIILPNETDCDNGCAIKDKCFSYGYRKAVDGGLRYCFESGEWLEQKGSKESCDNNFECDSNLCIDSECVSAGFFKRIMNWFARIFS